MRYLNIGSTLFRSVTMHACDKWTDRQNYDPQDRASIAVSRGNKNFSLSDIAANARLSQVWYAHNDAWLTYSDRIK